MSLVNKKLVKRIFKEQNVQTNIDALNLIEYDIRKLLERRAKTASMNNIKRLTSSTYFYCTKTY